MNKGNILVVDDTTSTPGIVRTAPGEAGYDVIDKKQ